MKQKKQIMNEIDNKKVYVGWSVGKSFISKRIQAHSVKDVVKHLFDLKQSFLKKNLATHVFAVKSGMVYQSHNFVAYNGHFYRGVHCLAVEDWLKTNKNHDYYLFPYNLSLSLLKKEVENNPGYGKLTILQLLKRDYLSEILKRLENAEPRDVDKGLICSEYLAICDKHKEIFEFTGIQSAHLIKPVHWQLLAYRKYQELIKFKPFG
jgi:hypothetical protein